MKAVVYPRPRELSLADLPDPVPGPGEVRVRVARSGICGTDLHLHEGEFDPAYPLVPGHEMAGVVDQIGSAAGGDATVGDLAVGDPVAVDNATACGTCRACGRDEHLFCEAFRSQGVNAPGGAAEYVVVRADKVFPIGDLTLDEAVLAEPTACAVHGLDTLALRPGADVAIVGAGPTGLLLAQLILHGGAGRVTVAAPTPFKLELARSYGVDRVVEVDRDSPTSVTDRLAPLAGAGFDVAVDATGAPSVIAQLPGLVRHRGTVFVYGMAPEQATVSLRPYDVFRRELTVKGSFAQVNCFERALRHLRSGRVRTEGIITHRFGLEDYGRALDTLRSDPVCLKAVIEP